MEVLTLLKLSLVAIGLLLVSCGPSDPPRSEQAVIPVASDSARYELVSRNEVEGIQIVLTERIGKSGTSFAMREIDCATNQARYIGEGDSLEEVHANLQYNNEMTTPLSDSITGEVVSYICS